MQHKPVTSSVWACSCAQVGGGGIFGGGRLNLGWGERLDGNEEGICCECCGVWVGIVGKCGWVGCGSESVEENVPVCVG